LEELMVMEAIRLSLLEQEERERREGDHGERSPESNGETTDSANTGETTSSSDDSQLITGDRTVIEDDNNNDDSELETNATTTVMTIDGEQTRTVSTINTRTTDERNRNNTSEVTYPSAGTHVINPVNDNQKDEIIANTSAAASSSSATRSNPLSSYSGTDSNDGVVASSSPTSLIAGNITDTFPRTKSDDDNATPSFEFQGDDIPPSLEGKRGEDADSAMMCI
jgi:hypothetical protein